MIEVKKREGESASALLFRFTKRMKRSGILRESRARRFRKRNINRVKRRVSAVHKAARKVQVERERKLGIL